MDVIRDNRVVNAAYLPAVDMNASAFANAVSKNAGVYKVDVGAIEIYNVPTSNLVTMKGRNAADNANVAVDAYVFNLATFKTTDNQAFQPTMNDGFNGKNIDRHILLSKNGRGLKIKAITFIGLNAAGNQDATVLQALDLQFIGFTSKSGKIIPEPIDLNSAIRNTQFQSGTLTLEFPEGVWINGATQMNCQIVAGATVTANIEWAK